MPAFLIDNEPQTHLDKILTTTKTLAMTKKVTTNRNTCQAETRLSEKLLLQRNKT
jgi:hypothetical protein